MAYQAFEDSTLRKVFAVALTASQIDPTANPPVVHLGELEQELRAEASSPDAPLLLSSETAERALMARLSSPPPTYPQWPVHYLQGCYARAQEESRSAGMLKDPADRQHFIDALTLARQLAVSYAGFTITAGMFPQPPLAEQRGALQLLDSLYASVASSGGGFRAPVVTGTQPLIPSGVSAATEVVPMPQTFLFDFATRHAEEGLDEVVQAMARSLMVRLAGVSLLGDFGPPLSALECIAACKPAAAALVRLPEWLPRAAADGRAVEFQTVLGPAFGISAIPDITANPLLQGGRLPDVAAQCFSDLSRPTTVHSAIVSIHAAMGQLHSQLHRVLMALLRGGGDAREAVVNWLAAAVRTNHERIKMQPDRKKAATEGFALNVGAVALKLCEPFVDPETGKAWPRLDARYASDPAARGRCFEDDTRLAATSEKVAAWLSETEGNHSGAGAAAALQYHFICESFFLTAQTLRLGFGKAMDLCQTMARQATALEEDAEAVPPEQAPRYRALAQRLKGAAVAMEACYSYEPLLNDTLAFYRLVAAYLVRLAAPKVAVGGQPELPLKVPAPMEFASLPEFFVDDLCSALSWVGRVRPELVTPRRMELFMLFFTVFLGSPDHINNPYLRGRIVEALSSYMPEEEEDDASGRAAWRSRPRGRGGRAADEVATLFEVHPLVVGHMVRSLILLYVDIERTGRSAAFYEKFNMRYHIGEILSYLWRLPQHRAAWRRVAETDPRLYIRFVNFMMTDSQHLLQEALDKIPEVQEIERAQEDEAGWMARPRRERAEMESNLDSHRRSIKNSFALAEIYLKTMNFTTEDQAVASRFFDLQVRDRQARILNFFLRYLTVPSERRKLKLKDPERYGWRPKELIATLASIHINLFRTDHAGWAAAVAGDTDYYGTNPEMFGELLSVLRTLSLLPWDAVTDLEALAAEAAVAVHTAAAEAEAFEEVPDEFEDPLSCQLMSDPVMLPSGSILDRSTILQHLLTDPRDPFNRAEMKEEDLVEQPELKGRIAAWVAQQRAKRHKEGEGGEAAAMQTD